MGRTTATGSAVAAGIAMLAAGAQLRADVITAQWLGWNGHWTDAQSWSTGVVPKNNPFHQYVVLIDGGRALDTSVQVAGLVTVNSVTVDHLDRLDVQPNSTFTAVEGMTVNGYASMAFNGHIRVGDHGTVGGTGAIEGFFGSTSITANGGSLTIGSGLRVGTGTGLDAGHVDIGGNYPLVNNGTIGAFRNAVNVLGTTVTNNGTFRVANFATLRIGGTFDTLSDLGNMVSDDGTGWFRTVGTVDNAASTFVIDRNVPNLEIGGTISGGTVTATAGNRLVTSLDGLLLDGVTLNAPTTVKGTVRVAAGQSLGGDAEILLEAPLATLGTNGGTFTIGSDLEVHGRGLVGGAPMVAGPTPLVNNGHVTADIATQDLTVHGDGITNNGTFTVRNNATLSFRGSYTAAGLGNIVNEGGTLRISGNLLNAGQTFTVGAPHDWVLGLSGRITGGTVVTLPGHNLRVESNLGVLDGVTLNGTVELTPGNATALNIDNGITGAGTILLKSIGGSDNRISNLKNNTFHPVVIGAGITVAGGSGRIFQLQNHGTIHAEPGATIVLTGSNGTTNAGTLRVSPNARMNSGTVVMTDTATLNVELAGPDARSYGQFSAGAATLDGDFVPTTVGGFVPASTSVFNVLSYSSRTGRFDPLALTPIDAQRSFSLHYDTTLTSLLSGEWVAPNLRGELDVPGGLLVSGPWNWSELLVKRGAGELVLDLAGDFVTRPGASLAIVDGTVRLAENGDRPLVLSGLSFGDLGMLTGNPELNGTMGFYYASVTAVPEPGTCVAVLVATAFAMGGPRRRQARRRGA